jgi:hypothetical protein
MHYAIIINLDYASHPEESCKAVWQEIRLRMLEAGFRCDGRSFTICRDEDEACQLARDVIESIEQHMDYHDKRIFLYIKEFYGFDMAGTTNLLLPADNSIFLEDDLEADD